VIADYAWHRQPPSVHAVWRMRGTVLAHSCGCVQMIEVSIGRSDAGMREGELVTGLGVFPEDLIPLNAEFGFDIASDFGVGFDDAGGLFGSRRPLRCRGSRCGRRWLRQLNRSANDTEVGVDDKKRGVADLSDAVRARVLTPRPRRGSQSTFRMCTSSGSRSNSSGSGCAMTSKPRPW
jgi:hypothetical protein